VLTLGGDLSFNTIRSMRKRLQKIPGHVIASVALHAALVAGLFLVAGIASTPPPNGTVVRADADTPEAVEPEPPEVTPQAPVPPPDATVPEVRDDPLEEPPIFRDESDPEDWNPDALPPSDAPPNWARKPIGIGPGGPSAAGPPPKPPAPKPAPRPKGPTKKAAAKHSPGPAYPRRAAERGYEGKVELLVEVLPTGKIGKIEVTKSSGFSILDAEAVRTVKGWVFEPAMIEGRPVRSLVVVPFSFEFKERR